MEYAIQLRNISKKYLVKNENKKKETRIVLDNINLDIRKGEVIGIIGRNGSGKSTLLSLIAKIIEPDEGTIIRSGKIASILELGMGFHTDMSGRENIYLKEKLYGFNKKEIDEKIDSIIKYAELEGVIDNPIRTYSSGMVARLAFSIMMSVESEIMVIDEILSVGDIGFVSKAKQHFKKLIKDGKTIIIVSHALGDIELMCDRVVWIEKGSIKDIGAASQVCMDYQRFINESPDIIKELANSGVAEAQFKLAKMYKEGVTVAKDDGMYVDLLKKSSDQYYLPALMEYGDYLLSNGDMKNAKICYEFVALRGSNEAQNKLSNLYSKTENDCVSTFIDNLSILDDYNSKMIVEYRLTTAINLNEYKEIIKNNKKVIESNYDLKFKTIQYLKKNREYSGRIEQYVTELSELSEKGYIPAKFELAEMYSVGKEIPVDLEKALQLYDQCSKTGHLKSLYKMAESFLTFDKNKMPGYDLEALFDRYNRNNKLRYYKWVLNELKKEKRIKSDDLEKYGLDQGILETGVLDSIRLINIASQEDDEILSIITCIADSGELIAIKKLASYYEEGIGVEKDLGKAVYWLERGDELGDTWSQNRLAEKYRYGIGVEQNPEMAASLYMKCAERGVVNSMDCIIQMYVTGAINSESVFKGAMELIHNAAKTGELIAIKKLASYYEEGIGVEKDLGKAVYWLERGDELGDTWCKKRLNDNR